MIGLVEYLHEHLKSHIAIEAYRSGLTFEKNGLFDGCEDIVIKIAGDIKRRFRSKKDYIKFSLSYNASDFKDIANVFFETLIINASYQPYCSGEYKGKNNNINNDNTALKNVTIEIDYSDLDWRSLSVTLTHELTHAFEDFNRCRKENIKTLADIETPTYVKAIANLDSFADNIANNKKFVSFYIYLCVKSELNAFIASFNSEIKRLDNRFDLGKEDVIKLAFDLLHSTSSYVKYSQLYDKIMMLHELSDKDKKEIELIYNDLSDSDKSFNAIAKEMKTNIIKFRNKLDNVIPKIICDYIDKHTETKVIERLIPDHKF